jgi:SAM-dependent methyltransferase
MKEKKKWFEVNPLKEKDVFISADKKYGDYNYKEDLRTLYEKEFNKILSGIVKGKNKKIFIGGSNSGKEITSLGKNSIFALDASKKALEKLSKKYPSVETLHWDLGSTLPFKDNFFDVYICLRAINSSTINLIKALNESLRITKPKGKIILSISNGYLIKSKIQKGLYDYKKKDFDLDKPYMIVNKIKSFYEKQKCLVKTIEFHSEIILEILVKK